MTTHRTVLSLASLALAAASLAPGGAAVARDVPTCDGQPATVVGTTGADHLHGTAGHDVIVGLGGNDVLRGGTGDDVLCGGDGDDHLLGGQGDDTLLGAAGTDVLDDRGGRSTMRAGAGNDFLQAEAGDGGHFEGGGGNDTFFIVSDHAHLSGGAGDDELELLSPFWTDESLAGGAGHDLLRLDLQRHRSDGPGYVHVSVDLAAGRIQANRRSAPTTGFEDLVLTDEDLSVRSTLPAISKEYVIRGTRGPNELIAGVSGPHAVPVSIFGSAGRDVLRGGSGPDLLNGGPGRDRGDGRGGHDVCRSLEVSHHCEG